MRQMALALMLLLSACASSSYMGISLMPGQAALDVQEIARAARAGDQRAQLELGIMLQEGNRVPVNFGAAQKLLEAGSGLSSSSRQMIFIPSKHGLLAMPTFGGHPRKKSSVIEYDVSPVYTRTAYNDLEELSQFSPEISEKAASGDVESIVTAAEKFESGDEAPVDIRSSLRLYRYLLASEGLSTKYREAMIRRISYLQEYKDISIRLYRMRARYRSVRYEQNIDPCHEFISIYAKFIRPTPVKNCSSQAYRDDERNMTVFTLTYKDTTSDEGVEGYSPPFSLNPLGEQFCGDFELYRLSGAGKVPIWLIVGTLPYQSDMPISEYNYISLKKCS